MFVVCFFQNSVTVSHCLQEMVTSIAPISLLSSWGLYGQVPLFLRWTNTWKAKMARFLLLTSSKWCTPTLRKRTRARTLMPLLWLRIPIKVGPYQRNSCVTSCKIQGKSYLLKKVGYLINIHPVNINSIFSLFLIVDQIFKEAHIKSGGLVKYKDFTKVVVAPVPDYYFWWQSLIWRWRHLPCFTHAVFTLQYRFIYFHFWGIHFKQPSCNTISNTQSSICDLVWNYFLSHPHQI